MLSTTAFSAIILYLIFIIILIIIKPKIIYDHNKQEFKHFGLNKNETPINLLIVGIISSFAIYNILPKKK